VQLLVFRLYKFFASFWYRWPSSGSTGYCISLQPHCTSDPDDAFTSSNWSILDVILPRIALPVPLAITYSSGKLRLWVLWVKLLTGTFWILWLSLIMQRMWNSVTRLMRVVFSSFLSPSRSIILSSLPESALPLRYTTQTSIPMVQSVWISFETNGLLGIQFQLVGSRSDCYACCDDH